MSSTCSSGAVDARVSDRLEVLFDELSELAGQRNAMVTGARSVAALIAWKIGSSPANAHTITAVADRLAEFPRCAQGLREGRLSLDKVGVIARRAGQGSDEHYAQLAEHATVSQLRTAVKLEPRPDPEPEHPWTEPKPSITKTTTAEFSCYRITLPTAEAATFDAALQSHHDALIAEYKHDHGDSDDGDRPSETSPPLPTKGTAFLRLVETGWDAEVAARPHGQRTTVVMHLDLNERIAALHLGPLLTESERRYLSCDATYRCGSNATANSSAPAARRG